MVSERQAFRVDASFGQVSGVVTQAGLPHYPNTVAAGHYNRLLTCLVCGKGPLSSQSSLNRHQTRHCPALRRIGYAAEQLECQDCHEPMSRLDALNRHREKYHPRTQSYRKAPKPPTRRRRLPTTNDDPKNMILTMANLSSSQSTTDSTMCRINTNHLQFPPNTPFPDGIPIYLTGGVLPIQATSDMSSAFSGGYHPPASAPTHQPLNLGVLHFPTSSHNDQTETSPPPVDAMTDWQWLDLLSDVEYIQSLST